MIYSIKYTRGIDDYYLYFYHPSNNHEDCKKALKDVCHHICEVKQIDKENYNPYIFITENLLTINKEMAERGFKKIPIIEIAEFTDEESLSENFIFNGM